MKNIFEKQDNLNRDPTVETNLLYGDPSSVNNPLVSIVITAYKRPDYFEKALESCVNQDFKSPYEIVVVDNNDFDKKSPNLEVVERVNDAKVLYYRHTTNIGYHGSVNRGLIKARGKYVVFCHDDDILDKCALSTLVTVQERNGCKAVLGSMITIDDSGEIIKIPNNNPDKYKVLSLLDCFLHGGLHSGSLFEREKLIELGGYNKDYNPASDYALNILYCCKWGLVHCFKPTGFYRHAKNASSSMYADFVERDFFFRKCLMEKIHLPNLYLNLVNQALYRRNKVAFAIEWGGADKSLLKALPLRDKFLIKTFLTITNLFSKECAISRGL